MIFSKIGLLNARSFRLLLNEIDCFVPTNGRSGKFLKGFYLDLLSLIEPVTLLVTGPCCAVERNLVKSYSIFTPIKDGR
jgi:hypothetical protein